MARAQETFEREVGEARAVAELSRQRMMAAERLQGMAAAEPDPARKAELEHSLGTLLSILEEMVPDMEGEGVEAKEAEAFLGTLRGAYDAAGRKLKDARSALRRAGGDMSRAATEREAAEERAAMARQMAGLSDATSSLSATLGAMRDAAGKDLAHAEAQNAKARLLAPSEPERADPNIARALAEVGGGTPADNSLRQRLASLRTRIGAASRAERRSGDQPTSQ